ncbi:MAG: fucose isomerase [Ignavibacteria bacterium]|nr:fucose isomerase [Ignavibacteria bacterium]
MRFQYLPVASEFARTEEAITSILGIYFPHLDSIGGERVNSLPAETPLPLLYFVATGGTENDVLALQGQRKGRHADEPVFLLAHAANNSLPAAMEILAKLQQEGRKGRILFLRGAGDSAGFTAIEECVRGIEVYRKLRSTRIGAVGKPSDWLVASAPDFSVAQKSWGPEIVPVDIEEIHKRLDVQSEEEIQKFRESLVGKSSAVLEPSARDIDDVVRVYLALKNITHEYNLQALTVRCFDLVLRRKTTGCFALAELMDEGIIAGCEGDIMSVVGMTWAYQLLQAIPWMANPSDINIPENVLILAHCTIPRKLVQGYTLRSHFESGLGLGIQGTLPEGPVTLLRLGGSRLEKIWLAEGTILRNGTAENLCRTQVEIKLDNGGHVEDLLRAPLGNHIIVLQGRYMKVLQDWWDLLH